MKVRNRISRWLLWLAWEVVSPEWHDLGCGNRACCPMDPPTVPWWRTRNLRNRHDWPVA